MTIRVSRQRTFSAAPDRIWALVDEPARMGRWFAFAERMELLEGSGLGRRQRLHGRWGTRRSQIDQRVVRYEPGRVLTWRHEAERLDGEPAPRFAAETRFEVTLQREGAGTTVRLESAQTPAGLLPGLVMRATARSQIGRRLDRSLDRLDELLSRQEHDPS